MYPNSGPEGQPPPGYGPPPAYPPPPPNPNNERVVASLAHWLPIVLALLFAFLVPLLGALVPFVAPLIVLTTNQSVFVREHAREALNFQLTVLIPGIVFAVLAMVLSFGWVFALLLYVGCLPMQVMGAAKAASGEWFRYPVAIRFVPPPGNAGWQGR